MSIVTTTTATTQAHTLVILNNVPILELAAKHRAIETLFDQKYNVFVFGDFRTKDFEPVVFRAHQAKIEELWLDRERPMLWVKDQRGSDKYHLFAAEDDTIKQVRFVLASLRTTEE